jgi:hypothetical protein
MCNDSDRSFVTLFRVAAWWLALAIAPLLLAQPRPTPTTRPARQAVDPQADAILRRACDVLASARQFSFEAHSTVERPLTTGQKVQFARTQRVCVRRPDAASTIIEGDRDDLQVWYDGKQLGLYNRRENLYCITPAPPTIDAALDMLAERHGMTLPLADLVMSDPYKAMAAHVSTGTYLGTGFVFDAVCHHLAFRQDGLDWEIWISQDEHPLPRKLAIVYRNTPDALEFVAYLSQWDLAPKFRDTEFSSPAPKDARELPFRGTVPSTTQPGDLKGGRR